MKHHPQQTDQINRASNTLAHSPKHHAFQKSPHCCVMESNKNSSSQLPFLIKHKRDWMLLTQILEMVLPSLVQPDLAAPTRRAQDMLHQDGGGDEERGLDEEEGDGKEKGKEKSGKRATRSRAAAAAAKKKKTG